jgi:molecular chaperone DnaJ
VRDPYEVLGVSRMASDDEIRDAFRRQARLHHPDANPGDADAHRRFQELNAAFQILTDPERRARFDRLGDTSRNGGARSRGPDWTDLQDLLRDLFGGFRPPDVDRGDVSVVVEISFEESVRGCSKTLRYPRRDTCPECGGSGSRGGRRCSRCDGDRLVIRERELEVTLPAGIESGAAQSVPGAGHRNDVDRPPGDLELVVRVEPDPRFRREGDDVHCEADVSYALCALGGSVEVETPFGKEQLSVPSGTQHGDQLRLRGRGIPHRFRAGNGDQFVRVRVRVPIVSSERARSLLSEYDEALKAEDGFLDKVRSWFAD